MAFDFLRMFGPDVANRLMQPSFTGGGNMLERVAQAAPPLSPPVDVPTRQVASLPAETPTASPAPSMGQTAVPQKPMGGGFGSGIDKQYLNDFFLGMAMGQDPMQSLALGAAQASKGKSLRGDVNETVKWLTGRGMDEGQAKLVASNPQTLQQYLTQMMAPQDPMKALQLQKTQLEIQNMQNPQPKMTDDQREYEAARAQGFDGTFMDYMVKMNEAGRQQVNIDTGVKLPAGFRWIDPNDQNKGVEPIPGGPGEQIPGELAARVGMADEFMRQVPQLREQIAGGNATGPIDNLMGRFGVGDQGQLYQQLQSGTDVLMRLLTGAGMNQTEAEQYAQRYLPTMKDDANTMTSKLDRLVRELEATKSMAMRGRGPRIPGQDASAPSPGGVVDYRDFFGGQ